MANYKKEQKILGIYTVESPVIVSDSSRVWKVFHEGVRLPMAMKQLKEDCFGDSGADEMDAFKARAEMWRRLPVSPYIVQCYNAREIDGAYTLLLEWCGGATLTHWVKKRRGAKGIPYQRKVALFMMHILLALRTIQGSNGMPFQYGFTADDVMLSEGCFSAKLGGFASVHKNFSGYPEDMSPQQLSAENLFCWARCFCYMLTGIEELADGSALVGSSILETRESWRCDLPERVIRLLRQCLDREEVLDVDDAVSVMLGEFKLYDEPSCCLFDMYLADAEEFSVTNNLQLALMDRGEASAAIAALKQCMEPYEGNMHPEIYYNILRYRYKMGEIDRVEMEKALEPMREKIDDFQGMNIFDRLAESECKLVTYLEGSYDDPLLLAVGFSEDGSYIGMLDPNNSSSPNTYYSTKNGAEIKDFSGTDDTNYGAAVCEARGLHFELRNLDLCIIDTAKKNCVACLKGCNTPASISADGRYLVAWNRDADKFALYKLPDNFYGGYIMSTAPDLERLTKVNKRFRDCCKAIDGAIKENDPLAVLRLCDLVNNVPWMRYTHRFLALNRKVADYFKGRGKGELDNAKSYSFTMWNVATGPVRIFPVLDDRYLIVGHMDNFKRHFCFSRIEVWDLLKRHWVNLPYVPREDGRLVTYIYSDVEGNVYFECYNKMLEDWHILKFDYVTGEMEPWEIPCDIAVPEGGLHIQQVMQYAQYTGNNFAGDGNVHGLPVKEGDDALLLMGGTLLVHRRKRGNRGLTFVMLEIRMDYNEDEMYNSTEYYFEKYTGVAQMKQPAHIAPPDPAIAAAAAASAAPEKPEETPMTTEEAVSALEELVEENRRIVETATGGKAQPERVQSVRSETQKRQEVWRTRRLPEMAQRFSDMREKLLGTIKGQDHVIHAVCDTLFRSEVMAEGDDKRRRPRAVFTFAGPPGVGKTYLAEQLADYMSLPYKRFDMSEYNVQGAVPTLIGREASYESAGEGKLTGYVKKNPKCILLFDEIEKASPAVIQLFYQMLDLGVLTDTYYSTKKDKNGNLIEKDPVVPFRDTIIIMTSNAGASLYEGAYSSNCAGVPTKTLLKALETETRPNSDEPFFPRAIVSRIATGCPLLFNHLKVNDLLSIMEQGKQYATSVFESQYGVRCHAEREVMLALLYSKGGKSDARSLRAGVESFFSDEILKVFSQGDKELLQITDYRFKVDKYRLPLEVEQLFADRIDGDILVYANRYFGHWLAERLKGSVNVHCTQSVEQALKIAAERDVCMVLIDPALTETVEGEEPQRDDSAKTMYNSIAANEWRDGKRLFSRLNERMPELAIYLLDNNVERLRDALVAEFEKAGARGRLTEPDMNDPNEQESFVDNLRRLCKEMCMQAAASKIAEQHKVLYFESAPKQVDGELVINLRNFELKRAVDAEDAGSLLSDVDRPSEKFDDVIGAEEAKKALKYYVNFLQNPKKFIAQGGTPPKGVLLYGEPGTGKTMLARALAGESKVAFFTAAASSFVDTYTGSGPKAVRELFERARRYAPSIVFIDEIDTIGAQRGGGEAGKAEKETLNQLLTEMGGFNDNSKRPVFVLAATNFGINPGEGIGVLDGAFVRRFDDTVKIELPNKKERRQLLALLVSKVKNSTVTDEMLDSLADRSPFVSPSKLTTVVEMAKRNSIEQKKPLDDDILNEAFEKVLNGEKKEWSKDYMLRTARHECGHALVCWLSGETPSYLNIEPRGNMGGYMQHADNEDIPTRSKKQLIDRIRVSLAGRAAEMVYYGDEDGLDTGASSDLQNATNTARNIITVYGMDERYGMMVWNQNMNEVGFEKLREGVNSILEEQLAQAKQQIRDHKERFDALVEALMETNKLTGEKIDAILSGKE